MKIFKLVSATLISICLGLVFIYSGYTKMLPVIETFEFTFVDIGIGNWYTAPLIARLLIGLEFFLGGLLILNYNLKRFTLPFTAALLLFFILYLTLQIIISGNNGNCGCFGEHLKMTPLEGILKNVALIAGCVAVYFLSAGWTFRYNKLFLSLVGVSAVLVPFILNPIDYSYSSNNLEEKVNYQLDIDKLLYHPEDTSKADVPKIELRTGRHVLAFLSLSCPHCRIAAKKFRLIKKNDPSLSIYFILNGDRQRYKEFIEDTKADNVPYSFAFGKTFIQLAGTHLPRIYYIDNSVVVKKVDYFEMNQYKIKDWMDSGKIE